MPDEPGPPALDLAFLGHQTFGDHDLEREILALFDAQCVRLLPIVLGRGERQVRADAAHTLTGAAGAVGAGQVAALAAAVEAGLVDVATLSEMSAGEAPPHEPRADTHATHAEVLACPAEPAGEPRSTRDRHASFEAPLRSAPQSLPRTRSGDEEGDGSRKTSRPDVETRLAEAVAAARVAVAARLHDR